MSAQIVNLRLARKAKRRAESDAAASAQRAKHGRTRSERDSAAAELVRGARHLEGHRLVLAVQGPKGAEHGDAG